MKIHDVERAQVLVDKLRAAQYRLDTVRDRPEMLSLAIAGSYDEALRNVCHPLVVEHLERIRNGYTRELRTMGVEC